ncbi:MAG: hypothetical protein KF851_14885 [Pirellulaceae bacterium]|jgi:hypothetical protein|nr:hypothetical protein [Pirellulaceae bacterium]
MDVVCVEDKFNESYKTPADFQDKIKYMNRLLHKFEMIDETMAEVLRQKTDAQRLRSVDAFWQSARAILLAAIRTEHPDWEKEKVQREVARRISNGVLDDVDA